MEDLFRRSQELRKQRINRFIMKEIETISGNQVFIVDGKCDFSKPSIFEQLAKICKLKYRKIKKYNKLKNKQGVEFDIKTNR